MEHFKQIWKSDSDRLRSKWNSWHRSKIAGKRHFPPPPGGGKAHIQAALNKPDHLNVKPLGIRSAPPGRRSFALAQLPAEIHCKVRPASARAWTQQGKNWSSATLTSFCSSRCKITATNIPLKLLHPQRGQNYSSHQRFQALLVPSLEQHCSWERWARLYCQNERQQPAALCSMEFFRHEHALVVLW